MILDLRATKAVFSGIRTKITEEQIKINAVAKIMRDKTQFYSWQNGAEKESAEATEFATRLDVLATKLQDALSEFWSVDSRLDTLIRFEDEQTGREVAKLKAEIEEQKQKVAALFQLDEQNCELKRKLREIEERGGNISEHSETN